MDKINEFLQKTYAEKVVKTARFELTYVSLRPKIVCNDGYEVSVQASENHYCKPRENKAWPYSKVELGFPNKEDELINEYAEDDEYTKTVYGWVPVDVVNKLIEKHGGINWEKTFEKLMEMYARFYGDEP